MANNVQPFDIHNKLGTAVAVANAVIEFASHARTVMSLKDNNLLKDNDSYNDELILKESYYAAIYYKPNDIKLAAIRTLEIHEADWIPKPDKELIAKSDMFNKA